MKTFELLGDADLILASIGVFVTGIATAGWWIAGHPAKVRAFIDRARQLRVTRSYRSLIEALTHRLRPEAALGLVITLGLLTLWFIVWIGGLLEHAIALEETALFDGPILSFIASHRVASVTKIMEVITFTGSEPFLVILIIPAGIALWYRTHSWQPLLLLAASVLGAMLLESVAKQVIARPRPPSAWTALQVSDGFAFPSGHSARSVAAYCALAYLIARTQNRWARKIESLTVGTLIAFLIGISRIYLGVHWPTDVMAGWALGLAWLAIIFTAYSTIMRNDVFETIQSRSVSAEPDGNKRPDRNP